MSQSDEASVAEPTVVVATPVAVAVTAPATHPRKPPALVISTIACPTIYEQAPSKPASPTMPLSPYEGITADLMQRIQLFSSQFDHARLSPNYATSDLGSSARSSFSSTTSSFLTYRDRSVDFDEAGKELISPFDCDTNCSGTPYSLSTNSGNHFSFEARSVSSLGHSTAHFNQLLAAGAAYELSRERSRSESDMQPTQEDDVRHLNTSTISVPIYAKKPLHKFGGEIKRSSSTPPPTSDEREQVEQRLLLRPSSGMEIKKDLETTNSFVSSWAREQIFAMQNATMYNLLTARSAEDCSTISTPGPLKVFPRSKDDMTFAPRDDSSRAKQMQYPCTLCGQAFAVHDRLAKHIASRHRQRSCTLDDASKVHKCNMCSKSFSRSDMLTRHMRLHTGAKPYSCPTCNQVFSRSDHLSTHLRTHTGEKPYACPMCNYSASRRDMISRHMRTHSLTDDSSISTPISQLSIRSATTSPLPPKIGSTATVEIGSGLLSAFKPILSASSSNLLSVSSPFQSLSLSTPPSPSFAPIVLNRQLSFDVTMRNTTS